MLERETVVPLALSKAVFVFLTAIFSNVPVLTFDACSKCQRECLPKPAGKKKTIESQCERAQKNHVLSNEGAQKQVIRVKKLPALELLGRIS